ncbi:hypothetical protein CKK33_15195 [Mucilaginibacter sp. MD40]|uniref:glycoside hydrolase domain-containing protein n=1 Tax=Mucilaginibacter sp. MD40 TaxID=2029590 RepID=UPI000BAC82A1|nr:glycoside hydrolase domain-containing protein [Mucilaginibacter sp. MD40]PAW94767.1 hypothetical protein CKK33_15195 [Mucilaginibacter sp. MD40]
MKQVLVFAFLLFTIKATAQNIPYTNCNNCWLADSLGNHRVVLSFNGTGKVAKAVINWRRRDNDPQSKRVIIEDAKTHQRVKNVKVVSITRETGELLFEPVSGNGEYNVYYLPYKNEGRSNYPKGVYLKSDNQADSEWLGSLNNNKSYPLATVKEFQSIDAFNSFYPMEVIATQAETEALIKKYPNEDFLVFPEDRMYSIRMTKDLPQRWIANGPQAKYLGKAVRGEHFAFQLGVYALRDISGLQVNFSDLRSASGKSIPATKAFCINNNLVTYDAHRLTKSVDVKQHDIQPLWCQVDVPVETTPALYKGKITISQNGKAVKTLDLAIEVSNQLLKDGGVSEPVKMTRLGWLNSTMAQQNTVIAPYTPLVVNGKTISLLGRKVEIGSNGFPAQIQTYFTPEMTGYATAPNNLLSQALHFNIVDVDGKNIILKDKGLVFTKKEAGTVSWTSISANDNLQMDVSASLEFDGFVAYTVKIKALRDIALKDIGMQIPLKKEFAKYMMGLGLKGGYRPETFEWKWDVAHKNQDGAWVGNVNGGLQYSLRDERYVRPLNTNFYLQKPLLLPTSWGNADKGGIAVTTGNTGVLVNNYSGARTLKKGDELYYNFNLLITPFHPINTDFQWQTRFYHAYKPIDTVKQAGATVINIHHATAINPNINYPFIAWREMKAYDDSAHAAGLKVKIYNTIRELSNHAYETFALRSLGHEIFSPGKGGGFSWLQEHLGDDYIAAWFVPEIKDAAIINSGMNRWHNYYVEGMNWLTENVGIDGIYLDDVAFDRVTMKRIKRVLTKNGHPGIIDLHSANQYNKSDGFNNSANLYMEHFPYLNRLWFGEYFDYEKNDPDFFLTEVSGIPFGLMGEMLQGGGNKWRGMVYGMTNRMPWSDGADPRPIWKAWDDFGMKGTKMIGYWVENSPVKTDKAKVLATVYKKDGAAMVSIASWENDNTDIKLKIDWKQLGINPTKATITAPAIKDFQPGRAFKLNDAIPVEKGKGWLLIIK